MSERYLLAGVVVAIVLVALLVGTQREEHETIHVKSPHHCEINEAVTVYYVGPSDNITDYIPNVVRLNGTSIPENPHILIVDGPYVEDRPQLRDLVKRELLAGTPVIVLDDPSLIKETVGNRFFAEAVAGQGSSGNSISTAKVYGYVYNRNGTPESREFVSMDEGPEGILDAYCWAIENMNEG